LTLDLKEFGALGEGTEAAVVVVSVSDFRKALCKKREGWAVRRFGRVII
jgi:hypothetical protein